MLSVGLLEITEWNEIFSKGFKILQGEKKLNAKKSRQDKKNADVNFYILCICHDTHAYLGYISANLP